MTTYFAAIAAAISAAGASAIAETEPASALAELVRLTDGPCYDISRGEYDFIAAPDVAAKTRMVESFGLEFGIDRETHGRMTPGQASILNGTTMGTLALGHDSLVLVIGGRAPGCTTIWLSPSGESREYEIVEALIARGWREPRPGMATQRGSIGKRMLIRRDDEGQPHMLNVLTITETDSEMRHATVMVPIPPHVTLPEGF